MPTTTTAVQRAITVHFINQRRLQAPTVWLKPESAVPDTAPGIVVNDDWLSPDEQRNLGVQLVDGFVELQISSPDDIWTKCFFEACASLHVDARAAYGAPNRVSSIIFQVDKPAKLSGWNDRWPKGHKDKAGVWVKTDLVYSEPATKTSKMLVAVSRPLPGSRFAGALVVWRPMGKAAAEDGELGLEDLEVRPIAATSIESICRAIAFATLAYWIRLDLDGLTEWDESLTRLMGGWTVRLVHEGQDINARGKSLEQVCWAPIDSADTAADLLNFLSRLGAGRELGVFFSHAEGAWERGQKDRVAGWGAIEDRFGPQAKVGLRRAFKAGLDIDQIEEMSDRYIYDRETHSYLDREALSGGRIYEHSHDDLVRDFETEPIHVGTKRLNPFKLYSGSSLRNDVEHREFFPGAEPGAIVRYSRLYGLLNGGDGQADEFPVLNIFPGFHIKPIATIDEEIMRLAVSTLDRMLGLLTQDNDAQMLWLKKFVAWIIQHPEIKQQVCPVIVGGQGIGKSLFGSALMRALFGEMAGSTNGSALKDDRFLITPFEGKLITFLDEVRLEAISAINEIKKLIREDHISGQRKFKDQKTFYIPSRLMIAANQPNIGLTPDDAADRAFFFIISWTAENKRMTDREFQAWGLTLKPFYSDFVRYLNEVPFKRHLMRYFSEIECTREELEDLSHSSRDDENVIKATMSKAREIARMIVADARVIQGLDITAWFTTSMLREAIKRVDGIRTKVEPSQVLMEYQRANIIEIIRGDLHKFKFKYGTLIQKLGEAHGLPITNYWDYDPDDFGDNEVRSSEGAPEWRGNRQRRKQQEKRRKGQPSEESVREDPNVDYMPDF